MEKIRKNFGFGCMRLPMIGEDVDMEQTKQMVDCFLEQGFNYFDTAHGYLQGKSELALKECLTSRYPREDYVLTNKLSGSYFKKEEDIRPFFESQLAACGVDYFDFYLMHSQSTTNYQHYRDCRAYETAFALKAEGKIRHALAALTDVTKLIIAQRITSVMDADMIVILDDGKVHAVGTHKELLANDTIYQEIYASQMKGDDADGKGIQR